MISELRWRGERIEDVRAWTRARGETLVSYVAWRQVPNPITGALDEERREGVMPSSFWEHLCMTDGWHYCERERGAP